MNEENIVKKVCSELNITQKELANRLGTHLTTVQKWASSNELPNMAQKSIELLVENEKNKEIINSYKKFQELLKDTQSK